MWHFLRPNAQARKRSIKAPFTGRYWQELTCCQLP